MTGSTPNVVPALNHPLTVETYPEDPASAEIARLTNGIRAGNEDAFREFHRLYFDRLYRFLLILARGREEEARDTLQETMLRVVRYARKFESEEAFWCWLKAVARSAARDNGRKQVRYLGLLQRFTLHLQRATDEPADDVNLLLEESLEELDPLDRQFLEGKYFRGSSVRELASDCGLTERAVESRLLRLRRQLREIFLKKLSS